jgi:hypothetical protein
VLLSFSISGPRLLPSERGEQHMRITKIEDLHCDAGWRDLQE